MDNATRYKAINKGTGEEYVMIDGTAGFRTPDSTDFSFDIQKGEEVISLTFVNNNGELSNDEYDAVVLE